MSSLKRRLAAIVFTDIVGFTDLSSKDEEGAYKLVVKQREILKPIVEKHEGEWLKEEGDRFFSLKYILSSAFLLFFTVSIGIMLSLVTL